MKFKNSVYFNPKDCMGDDIDDVDHQEAVKKVSH